MAQLQTQLADQILPSPLLNASGAKCEYHEELNQVQNSAAAALITKSCTLEKRQGNPRPRYVETPWGSINAMGLPNQGWAYYADYAKEQARKPLFLSVAGLSLEENCQILSQLSHNLNLGQIAGIELNLSCPNLPNKPQTGYDFQRSKEVLTAAFEHCKHPLGVKLPPYFDPVHFDQMAEVLLNFPKLRFVTCVNSLGNGLVIDPWTEQVVLKPKEGLGGIGGDYIKPTALANVRAFYLRLNHAGIDVVGCGGIKSGLDAFEHLLCGASALQIGTQLMKEGPDCFARIEAELLSLMKQKGYQTIQDFKGRLQSL